MGLLSPPLFLFCSELNIKHIAFHPSMFTDHSCNNTLEGVVTGTNYPVADGSCWMVWNRAAKEMGQVPALAAHCFYKDQCSLCF